MGAGADVLDPITNASAWDKVLIGGTPNPGIAKLSGWKRVYSWEVKKGKGAKGSSVTLNEFPPAEGSVTVLLWEPAHFSEWRAFSDLLNYDPTKKPVSAIDIFHPMLAGLDVKSVVCKSLSGPEPQGKGLHQAVIELIEYNPPPKKDASKSPSSSKSSAGGSKPGASSDPIADAQQAEIARLLRQAQGLDKPENEHIPQRGG